MTLETGSSVQCLYPAIMMLCACSQLSSASHVVAVYDVSSSCLSCH